MNNSLQLTIPEPCHEKWNEMTPQQQGRFCGSCQKVVVDFTAMTDQQVLDHFSNYQGNTCGRFTSSQLNRTIAEPTPLHSPKWQRLAWAAMVSSIMVSAKAQGLVVVKDTAAIVKTPEKCNDDIRIGGIRTTQPSILYIVSGVVTDENGQPLSGATVQVPNTRKGTLTKENGRYNLSIPDLDIKTLQISYVGYETKTIRIPEDIDSINVRKTGTPIVMIAIKPVRFDVSEIALAGVVAVVIKKTKNKPALKSLAQKVAGDTVRISPNPAKPGSSINLQIKNKGNYQLQIVDGSGKMISASTLQIMQERQSATVSIPQNTLPGLHYLHLTDTKTKKRVVEKLIIVP